MITRLKALLDWPAVMRRLLGTALIGLGCCMPVVVQTCSASIDVHVVGQFDAQVQIQSESTDDTEAVRADEGR